MSSPTKPASRDSPTPEIEKVQLQVIMVVARCVLISHSNVDGIGADPTAPPW
jgi:hypothetical protein